MVIRYLRSQLLTCILKYLRSSAGERINSKVNGGDSISTPNVPLSSDCGIIEWLLVATRNEISIFDALFLLSK